MSDLENKFQDQITDLQRINKRYEIEMVDLKK